MNFWEGVVFFVIGGVIFSFLSFVFGIFYFSELGSEPTGSVVLGFILLILVVFGFATGGIITIISYKFFFKKKKIK